MPEETHQEHYVLSPYFESLLLRYLTTGRIEDLEMDSGLVRLRSDLARREERRKEHVK